MKTTFPFNNIKLRKVSYFLSLQTFRHLILLKGNVIFILIGVHFELSGTQWLGHLIHHFPCNFKLNVFYRIKISNPLRSYKKSNVIEKHLAGMPIVRNFRESVTMAIRTNTPLRMLQSFSAITTNKKQKILQSRNKLYTFIIMTEKPVNCTLRQLGHLLANATSNGKF